MPLNTGKILKDRYRVVKLLGQGGFGAVYRAWDITLERPCALKENLETSEVGQRQFEREAKLLANLSHPGLPHVTDHFFIEGQGQYLVMDYIEGEDLQEMLERTGRPLSQDQALEWIGQVCDALIYMHSQGPPVIHRDIKPANIRIMKSANSPQGRATLVDFGIAKVQTPGRRTTVGARAFTPGYSPPEQYGQGFTDAQSDVYSLGATLYALLTGQVPPDSVDIMSGSVPTPLPASRLNPQISTGVSGVIVQAMQVNRTQRSPSVAAFKAALERASRSIPAQDLPITERVAPVIGRESAIPRPVSKPKRARRGSNWSLVITGVGLALALGILSIAGGFWVMQALQNRGATETPAVVIATVTDGGRGGLIPSTTVAPVIPTVSPIIPTVAPVIPTNTVTSTPTQLLPPEPNAVLIEFPEARIAFVSDHGTDGRDRIYVMRVSGGSYWYYDTGDKNLALSVINTAQPFSAPIAMLADARYDVAWWPDWCQNNQLLLFEAQDTSKANKQAIFSVPVDGGSGPTLLRPGSYGEYGVPRCSHSGTWMTFSAYTSRWQMFRFEMGSPSSPTSVGDEFSFAGNASWSVDDAWMVYMAKPQNENFQLAFHVWGGLSQLIGTPQVVSAKYPAVSPISGRVAFACKDQDQWNLCTIDTNGQGFELEFENAVKNSSRPAPKLTVPEVTPSWSPDGKWIAFARRGQDGNWDILLFAPEEGFIINLTADLAGDQFEPSWSKP